MYGLIHKAIRGCVQDSHGLEAWERVADRVGADEAQFVGMEAYPDELTLGLLGAVSEELALALPEVYRMMGKYWVLTTARAEFGALFDFAGGDLFTVLGNLDAMHEQVAVIFTGLQQPWFRVEREDETNLLLYYRSAREGLSPFIFGLLDGLSEHFDEPIETELLHAKNHLDEADIFRVRFLK